MSVEYAAQEGSFIACKSALEQVGVLHVCSPALHRRRTDLEHASTLRPVRVLDILVTLRLGEVGTHLAKRTTHVCAGLHTA